MKSQLTKNLVRSTTLALCAAGLALSGPTLLRAEQATNPTTGTYGSGKSYKTTVERKSEGQLSAEDLHQASLLSSQLLMHLNAAATDCIDGKGDSAKPESSTKPPVARPNERRRICPAPFGPLPYRPTENMATVRRTLAGAYGHVRS